jgi:hypothetical protein
VVNVEAIPLLRDGQYAVLPADKRGIGGEAPKGLLLMSKREGPGQEWIAKAPRTCGPRECVTEHLISELGRGLPLPLAKTRLVRLRPEPGLPAEVRFLSRIFLGPGEALVHDVELVARWLEVEKTEVERVFHADRREEQSFYTIDLVIDVLRSLSRQGEFQALRDGFARMMAFDALIGTNDRHAMNWGVIQDMLRPSPLRWAPLFDTARGLFWHHLESDFERADGLSPETFVRNYAEKSKPLIGTPRSRPGVDLNHFEVIDYMMNAPRFGAALRAPIRQIVAGFHPHRAYASVIKRFGRILTARRLRYVHILLRYRHARLKILTGLAKE